MKFNLSDRSISIDNIKIKVMNDNALLDASSSILDISKINISTIPKYKSILFDTKSINVSTEIIGKYNLNDVEKLFNNLYIPTNTMNVSQLKFNIENNIQNNNIIINTSNNGVFEPNLMNLYFNKDFNVDDNFIPSESKIVFDISEQAHFGNVDFNSNISGGDLSLNIVKDDIDANLLFYDFKQKMINHIRRREDDEPLENGKKQEMLGVKKLRIDISNSIISTTNNQYLNTEIESNIFNINVINLKTPSINNLIANEDNKSVKLIIKNEYSKELEYSLQDISKGMISFVITKYDKKNNSFENLELSGNDIAYDNDKIIMNYDINVSVYDTLDFTVSARYNWIPENTTNKLYVSSPPSNKSTMFVCFNNKYNFGIYNTSSDNTRLYIPISKNDKCFKLSGNVYSTTTNQLTKSQVFSKLAKMRIKPR